MTDFSIQRIVSVQLITSLVIAAAIISVNMMAAWSTLLGGLSVVVPSAFMALRLSLGQKRAEVALPEVALAQLISAELGKLLITGLMIGAVFVWAEPKLGFFFFGLIATYSSGLVSALWLSIRSTRASVTSGK